MSMILHGDGSDSFSLSIDGYQFPEMSHERDADWLNVRVRVIRGDQTWEFVDSCLMASEFELLIEWMRSADIDGPLEDAVFMEDTLRLSKEIVNGEPSIVVYISKPSIQHHELPMPPWHGPETQNDDDFKQAYSLQYNDMKAAATALVSQLHNYPSRWDGEQPYAN
jgi:hypothetical protein